MRFAKVFILLVLFFHLGSIVGTAQAVDLDFILPSCGFADEPNGGNKCCPAININEKVISPVKLVVGFLPGGFLLGGFADAIGEAWKVIPYREKIEPKCHSGREKTLTKTDPRTGKVTEKCICTSEDFEVKTTPIPTGSAQILKICEKYAATTEKEACKECANSNGLLTGLGCIKTDYASFISEFLLRMGIGFGGLFSLGCIIVSAIRIQTSGGETEKISAAQEQIKACLLGLMLVMFSILLLKIIGVSILGIPGFI